jgi:hypothetical protein
VLRWGRAPHSKIKRQSFRFWDSAIPQADILNLSPQLLNPLNTHSINSFSRTAITARDLVVFKFRSVAFAFEGGDVVKPEALN